MIDKCQSSKLRRNLLEKVQLIAGSSESEADSIKEMESKTEVNSVSETHRKNGRCLCCGKEGHFARDQSCPARKDSCNNCHFVSMCKTKKNGKHEPESGKGNKRRLKASSKQRLHNVHKAEDNDEYAASVSEGYVSGVESGTDTGASCNVVKILKHRASNVHHKKKTHNVYRYGATEPLNTLGKFRPLVKLNDKDTEAEFLVISGIRRSLIGRKTALELGELKIGQLNSIDSSLKVRFQE